VRPGTAATQHRAAATAYGAIPGTRDATARRSLALRAAARPLERAEQCLKPGLSLAELEREALAMSDTECARKMNAAKSRLLRQCKVQSPVPPPFR
jgi:hypothetical protein